MPEWDGAAAKAGDLVRMSVMRAALLQTLEEISIDIHPVSPAIGAGVSGMTVAPGDGAGWMLPSHTIQTSRLRS